MELGTCIVEVATTILPVVAPGFSKSNTTVPLMPLALPLIASSTPSSLNTTLLTPLGSLKSNVCGEAIAADVTQPSTTRVCSFLFIICMRMNTFGLEHQGNSSQDSCSQHGDSQHFHSRHEAIFVNYAFNAGHWINGFL